ncbi:MAG: DNA primase small subunit domain-containing protein [Methanobacteriota archaeon]
MAAPAAAAPTPHPLLAETQRWLAERFARYYAGADIPMPSRHPRREWAFIPFDREGMFRHIAFPTAAEVRGYLKERPPRHAYYSTAYYQKPDAPTMKEKGWLGADLIFDLDADHLPNAKERSFPELVAAVRKETVKLVEDFLMRDFGYAEEDLHIVFSGGRGYHVHVPDPAVQGLGSPERREIVDYVTGTGLATQGFLWEEGYAPDPYTKESKKGKRMPGAAEAGWRGRVTREFVTILREILALEPEAARARLLSFPGIGPARAAALLSRLDEERLRRIETEGRVDQFPELAAVAPALLEEAKLRSPGEADEPVTTDVKRLIRLPGSLHGKTGLRVTPLTLDRLKNFDPFREAVAFGDDPVDVEVLAPVRFGLKGVLYKLEPGRRTIPEHAAVVGVGLGKLAVLPRS